MIGTRSIGGATWRRGERAALVAVAAALVACGTARADEKSGGARVPTFVLKDVAGKDVALADLLAKGPVLASFWATWCKPCLRELPHLEALHEKYANEGLQVVGISVDDTRSMAKARSYAETHGFGFRILLDSNQRVLRQLQGVTVPYLVLISPASERLYAHSGYRDGDEKELARVVAEMMAEYGVGDGDEKGDGEVEEGGGTDEGGDGRGVIDEEKGGDPEPAGDEG